LIDDRDSLESREHPFVLTYQVGDEAPGQLDVELKTRGHWRRQERNCDFPPLRLDVPRGDAEGTVFDGQDKLKLVTPCRPGSGKYDEYVIREFLVYRIYNLLTPLSHNVRGAVTTYLDSERGDSLTEFTFLLEATEQMAARHGLEEWEILGGQFEQVDSLQMGLVGVFLYMVGATDWSLRGLHNMELVGDSLLEHVYPVAYDFDFTGLVHTAYARPDPRLRLRSVRERLYRGRCLTDEHWDAVFAKFEDVKDVVYGLYEHTPGLSPSYVEEAHDYLDDFYEVLDDPGKTSRELIRRCRAEEGIQ
jgi:hypothetical protein